MAQGSSKKPPAKRATPAKPKTAAAARAPAPEPANDQDEPSLLDLAKGILAREIKPLAGHVRRLAESVLALEEKRAKKKGAGKKKAGRKKLAKIPGQKPKK